MDDNRYTIPVSKLPSKPVTTAIGIAWVVAVIVAWGIVVVLYVRPPSNTTLRTVLRVVGVLCGLYVAVVSIAIRRIETEP